MKIIAATVLIVCGLVPFVLLSILYYAWAAWVLWNWYAPMAGLDQASYAKVYALMTLFSVLKGPAASYASDEASKKENMIKFFFGPILSVAIGRVMLEVLK